MISKGKKSSAYDVFKKVSGDYLKQEVANIGKGDRDSYIHPDFELYKQKSGLNFIRICPPIAPLANKEYDFCMKIHVYRNIGVDGGSYLSLAKMFEEYDPVFEYFKELKAAGDEASAKELRPKDRYIYQILDTSNSSQSENVLIMDLPSNQFRPQIGDEVRALCQDPKTGAALDISDPIEGREISWKYTWTKGSPPQFTELKMGAVWPIETNMIPWLQKQLVPFEELLVEPDVKELEEIVKYMRLTTKDEREKKRAERYEAGNKDSEKDTGGFRGFKSRR